MRVLIVDDEALARLRLRTLIDSLPAVGAEVAGEAADATQALVRLQSDPRIDLLLLDIRMPGRDGLRLAAALRSLPRPPAVIFVTAYAEHALKAFELDAVDYLTKPVRRERLLEALQRVQARLPAAGEAAPARQEGLPEGGPEGGQEGRPAVRQEAPPTLVVIDRGRVLRLPLSEILFLKAELKYVTLRTAQHSYVLDDSLADLEQRLALLTPGAFLRVHRNALVARAAIRALELRETADNRDDGPEGWAVRVAPGDDWLAVSRRQVAAVRTALAAQR